MANWLDTGLNWLGIGGPGGVSGDTLLSGAQAAWSYFDEDDTAGTFGSAPGTVNLSGKLKTTVTTPRSATAMKIDKSPITSQGEATVAKHRNMLAKALNQAAAITAKSKRT